MANHDDTKTEPQLTAKQAKIVAAKIDAELNNIPQGEIAADLFPGATPRSAEVMLSRELKKVDWQGMMQEALVDQGISPNDMVKRVKSAMSARKLAGERIIYDEEGKIVERKPRYETDHSTRMVAVKIAATFMGIGKEQQAPSGSVHFHQHVDSKRDDYGL